jgi:predicted ABC-type ATPase
MSFQMNKPKSRLRIFAGPNGSGKSSLFSEFSQNYNVGFFLNADILEKELSTKGFIDLNDYRLTLTQSDLDKFLLTKRAKSLIQKANDNHHTIDIFIKENMIVDKTKATHSYEGALISSFLRYYLQEMNYDYCFETVMSHESKIEEVKEARHRGYKTYLYFICIDDPEVNISRVEDRVAKGGHNVDPDKIISRYPQTLKHLISMIENVDKCYLYDNSDTHFKLIAKIYGGILTLKVEPHELPNWFLEHVLPYYTQQ